MRPMARSLATQADVESVAEYVASLPPTSQVVTLSGGDAARGQASYALCLACHGVDGKGNEELMAPSIVESSDWYLMAQLEKFRNGLRGTNPKDTGGAQMRPMALALPNEQAMKDVITYVHSLR